MVDIPEYNNYYFKIKKKEICIMKNELIKINGTKWTFTIMFYDNCILLIPFIKLYRFFFHTAIIYARRRLNIKLYKTS